MFQLRRLDVWPVDDLGVRQGYGLAWGSIRRRRPSELDPLGERFRPVPLVVARYCWEAVPLFRMGWHGRRAAVGDALAQQQVARCRSSLALGWRQRCVGARRAARGGVDCTSAR